MCAAYGPYQDLEDYLLRRSRDHGHNLTSLSQELDFGRSYLSSVASGHFRPSVKRCREIAEFFGDDPDIILTLAGYRGEPLSGQSPGRAVARITNTLSPQLQRTLMEFAGFLSSRQSARQANLETSQIYVELPDGDGMTIDLTGDVSVLSKEALRLTIRATLNATLAGEQLIREKESAEAAESAE